MLPTRVVAAVKDARARLGAVLSRGRRGVAAWSPFATTRDIREFLNLHLELGQAMTSTFIESGVGSNIKVILGQQMAREIALSSTNMDNLAVLVEESVRA